MASDDDEKKQKKRKEKEERAALRRIVRAVAAGMLPDDAEANRLFTEWYPVLLTHARCNYPREDGEELAQMVVAQAWYELKAGKGEWESLDKIRAYLKKMLDNKVKDLHRWLAPREAYERDQLANPEAGIQRRPAAEVALYSQDINTAFEYGMSELLTDREQEVWQLHWVEKIPLPDIADMLSISRGTAAKHFGNASRAIRDYLKSRGMDPRDGGVA